MLCSNNDNVIIKYHSYMIVRENREYEHLYMFQHLLSRKCTESDSRCGFIIRASKQGDSAWTTMLDYLGLRGPVQLDFEFTHELCVDKDDYKNTGIHLHDVISARDMHLYFRFTGTHEGKQITLPGLVWWEYWLPHITDWKYTGFYVAYNLSEYLVAKRK